MRYHLILLFFFLLGLGMIVTGIGKNNPGSTLGLQTPPTPTISIAPTLPARDVRLYPNPALTPGGVFPAVTAHDVCTSGYAKSVRNVTTSEKRQVYEEYGIAYPEPPGSYEVDHFISLELGGSNDIKNLWPEPAEPRPGFHEKDEVENYLHEEVCSGKITLGEAQTEIKTDWYNVYLAMKHGKQ